MLLQQILPLLESLLDRLSVGGKFKCTAKNCVKVFVLLHKLYTPPVDCADVVEGAVFTAAMFLIPCQAERRLPWVKFCSTLFLYFSLAFFMAHTYRALSRVCCLGKSLLLWWEWCYSYKRRSMKTPCPLTHWCCWRGHQGYWDWSICIWNRSI